MAESEVLLKTHGLTKKFGKRTAVHNLDMEVLRGDIYGFLGPNGAGKSTTIRMVLTLIKPTAGVVTLFGQDIASNRAFLSRVGGLVERPDFYLYLSARRNLEIVSALYGGVDKKRIERVLDIVGLLNRADDRVKSYSHGMKQRLGIAQALVGDPELLILDEPTNGLDPQGMKEVRDLVLRLKHEENKTVFLSSHLLNEIEQVATRMCIIHEGELRVQGEVKELLSRDSISVRIDAEPRERALEVLKQMQWLHEVQDREDHLFCMVARDDLAKTNTALVQSGVAVSTFAPRYSLEDYFLSITENSTQESQKK
jgi:ABC-2 type transport system ATP-binding protein